MTRGRRKFTTTEFAKIRSLLGEKQRASRSRQKVIRQQIRNLGFYISDFGSGARGFGPKDLDRLVESGRIQVKGRPSPGDQQQSYGDTDRWPLDLGAFQGLADGDRITTTYVTSEPNVTQPDSKSRPRAGRLEPLLAPNLDVVFVGTEPGRTSATQGRYYAHPENTFYRDLHAAGFTPIEVRPDQYRKLLALGIGLDDVYHTPDALRTRLLEARPRKVCFNSKGALDRFVNGELGKWRGSAAGSYVSLGNAIVWAVPDSSPRAYRFHDQRVRLLRQLRDRLR